MSALGRLRLVPLVALVVALPLVIGWQQIARGEDVPPPIDGVRTVEIDIRFSRFSASDLTVRRGETVRFVIRNHDPIPHEFIVGDLTVQDHHEAGTETEHGEVPGEVTIPHNSVAETTVTFTGGFGPGSRLFFGCHLPGHWAYGMQGQVKVA